MISLEVHLLLMPGNIVCQLNLTSILVLVHIIGNDSKFFRQEKEEKLICAKIKTTFHMVRHLSDSVGNERVVQVQNKQHQF